MGILFNGTTQRVDFANESFFDRDWTDSWSVGGWVFPPVGGAEGGGAATVCKAGTGQGWAFDMNFIVAGVPTFSLHLVDVGDLWKYGPVAALPRGVWAHIAATYDGSASLAGINLYKNGLLVGGGGGTNVSSSPGSGSLLNNNPFAVGGTGNGSEWTNTGVSNVSFSKRVWSTTEIKQLADITRFETSPIRYLSPTPDFQVFMSDTSNLSDQSGNANSGSLVGSPTTLADPKVVYIGNRGQGKIVGTSATITFTTTDDILAGQHVILGDTHYGPTAHGNITSVTVGALSLSLDKRQLLGALPVQSEIWSASASADIASGATVTVTYQTSTSDSGMATVDVFDALLTSSYVDGTAGTFDSSGAATIFDSGTAPVTGQFDEVAYTVFGYGTSASDPILSPESGWTETVEIFDTVNLHHESSFKILTQPEAARHQPTCTTGQAYDGAIVTYKALPQDYAVALAWDKA